MNAPNYEVDEASGAARIPLTGRKGAGQFALVDIEDAERVAPYRWYGHRGRGKRDHVYAWSPDAYKRTGFGLMHRFILSAIDANQFVDHINHNSLDNRRCNLRLVSKQENQFNRRSVVGSSSQFKGVCWDRNRHNWRATARFNGKLVRLGSFKDEAQAAEAYDDFAITHHGEFVLLNFPDRTQ